METPGDVTRMRLIGGNLALDFVNTRVGPAGGPPDDDVLTGYPALLDWAVHAGALTAPEAARLHRRRDGTDTALTRALRARDRLDETFRALAAGRRPHATALARLRDDEADAIAHAVLAPGEVYGWDWRDDHTPDRPLRPVVHAATLLLTTGPLGRVKGCGGCSFLFLDESKNRSRRWCSMDDCGTAAKMRRYVDNRRTRATR